MKTKIPITILGLIVLSAMAGFSGQNENQQDEPMLDEIRMDQSAFDSPRRPAALFDHDNHNEKAELEDCGTCHHVWEDGKLVADESSEDSTCSDCHSLTPQPDNDMALANAYHTQCRTCHFDKGKGPVLCGQCHRKGGIQ